MITNSVGIMWPVQVAKLRTWRMAAVMAVVPTLFGVLLHTVSEHFGWEHNSGLFEMTDTMYGSLTSFVGILIVFRMSQAFSRFWEGSTLVHHMVADWYDASSTVIAFCRYSSVDDDLKRTFQQQFVRYMSLLNALILADLEGHPDENGANALNFELLDPDSMSERVFIELECDEGRSETVFQWIQNLVVDNIKTGVLNIPPPLLTRTFQELGKGMLHHRDALKYADTPYPFAYLACTQVLLCVHSAMTPIMTSIWLNSYAGITVFTFVTTFLFWNLHFTAGELENPFGIDATDLDLQSMQHIMNDSLVRLLAPKTQSTPCLSLSSELAEARLMADSRPSNSFCKMLTKLKHAASDQRGKPQTECEACVDLEEPSYLTDEDVVLNLDQAHCVCVTDEAAHTKPESPVDRGSRESADAGVDPCRPFVAQEQFKLTRDDRGGRGSSDDVTRGTRYFFIREQREDSVPIMEDIHFKVVQIPTDVRTESSVCPFIWCMGGHR